MMKYILVLFLTIFTLSIQAQTTGKFDKSISFDQDDYQFTRTLYYNVPSDYDENESYKLIVGFRGGPHSNAGHFRDQLSFLSDSLNAIIMCPENSAHFWNMEGLTKKLFEYSLDTTMAMYNIDKDFIYLTGLSYGGRHAVIVSMDTDDGPIPEIRGVIPFAAGSDSHLAPNYENISDFPPACICIGLNDSANFINVSNNLYNDIQSNNGTAMLNSIQGVGHTVAFPTYPEEMMKCLKYIDDQYSTTNTGFQEFHEEDIQLFPNPTNGILNISVPEDISIANISIVGEDGKRLLEFDPLQRRFDISKLENGIKTLILKTKQGNIAKQFAILK